MHQLTKERKDLNILFNVIQEELLSSQVAHVNITRHKPGSYGPIKVWV